jgi:hypothetical protein
MNPILTVSFHFLLAKFRRRSVWKWLVALLVEADWRTKAFRNYASR